MLKKIDWKEDAVLSIKLRDDLYSLVQMRKNHLMQFFDVTKSSNDWAGTDLNKEKTLCTFYVAEKSLKNLFVEQLDPSIVTPTSQAIQNRMLKTVFGNHGNHGANLIELTDRYDSVGGTIIQSGLTIEQDLDLIYSYQLVGMLGETERLKKILLRYFDTGVLWDDSKEFIFKGIQPPPPHYQRKAV